MADFEDDWIEDWLTPWEADDKRAMQDVRDGFFFTMNAETHGLECNKCKRVAKPGERPFPHRYDCPLKRNL